MECRPLRPICILLLATLGVLGCSPKRTQGPKPDTTINNNRTETVTEYVATTRVIKDQDLTYTVEDGDLEGLEIFIAKSLITESFDLDVTLTWNSNRTQFRLAVVGNMIIPELQALVTLPKAVTADLTQNEVNNIAFTFENLDAEESEVAAANVTFGDHTAKIKIFSWGTIISTHPESVENVKPKITFTSPAPPAAAYVSPGGSLPITWTAVDLDEEPLTINAYLVSSTSGNCDAGTKLLGPISEQDEQALTWSPAASAASATHYLCVTVDDGATGLQKFYSPALKIYRTCTWLGGSTVWATLGNWQNCNTTTPRPEDRIIIPSGATNQPTVAVATPPTEVDRISAGSGGTITISAGATLTLGHSDTISGDITIQGTANCTTCILTTRLDLGILNGATLTLGADLLVKMANDRSILVGRETSHGSLATGADPGGSRRPTVTGNHATAPRWNGITVLGTADDYSSVSLTGLVLNDLNAVSAKAAIAFSKYYAIPNMASVVMDYVGDEAGPYITLKDCNTADDGHDTTWTGMEFKDVASLSNIDTSKTCLSGDISFSVAGTGLGYGPAMELDPNGVVSWTTATSSACTWKMSPANSVWSNAANWDSCTNGRGGYPDCNDTASFPSGAGGMPITISGVTCAKEIATGTGSPTFSVQANSTFYVLSGFIKGNLNVQAATTSCTTCVLEGGRSDFRITNGATLTLNSGVIMRSHSSKYVYVGNDGGGTLTTVGGGDESASRIWPTINLGTNWFGIQLNGTSGNLAAVNFNGVRIDGVHNGYDLLGVVDYANFTKFDSAVIKYQGTAATKKYFVNFGECANTTVNDTSWTGVIFDQAITTGGGSINASGADCDLINEFTVNGSGAGFGANYANDPHGKITWTAQ